MADWQPIDTLPKDYSDRFLAAQDGEVYVAKYDTSTIPPALVFRQHRNHRTYAYFETEYQGQKVLASTPLKEAKEFFEHIWRIQTRGFIFQPTFWAIYQEPPNA